MERFGGWVSLIFSRKVLLAVIVAISAVVLYIQGAITADQLVDALMGLGAALILSIAGEDIAEKVGRHPGGGPEELFPAVTHPVGRGGEELIGEVSSTADDDGPPRWRNA